MRLISWILFVAVGTVAVLFAVDNRETVSLGVWPLPWQIDLPLFVPVLIAAAVGFLCGGAVAWTAGHRWRVRARRARRDVEMLERRLHAAAEQARRNPAPAPVQASTPAVSASTLPGPPARRAAG